MRIVLFQILLIVAAAPAAAEEFKYYVWIDEQGIVHAEEEAPKGVDYKVRIIEDINANVVPAEDFRLYGDLPVDYGSGSDSQNEQSASEASRAGESITPDSPDPQ